MLRMTARRFATLTLVAGTFAGTTAFAQVGGITQGDSQPAPRRSSPSRGETAPELDSRTGQGELARDVTARGADVGDDPHERTSFTGLVTSVAGDRITVKMAPPRVPTAMEQVFRVADEATVVVNGETAPLASIREGDTVRIITAAADPEIAVRIFAAAPGQAAPPRERTGTAGPAERETRRVPSRPTVAADPRITDEDEDPNFDVYPENEQGTRPRRPAEQAGGPDVGRMAMTGGEEAVLPLGIEVYGGGGRGALVTEMLVDGPAAAGGVLINDLIVAVNRQTVSDPELMEQMLLADGTGAAELTVVRNGETLQIPVQAGRLIEGSLVTPAAMHQSLVTAGFVGGAPVAPFTFGGTLSDFRGGGVLIDGTEGSLVGGLLPGDVITGLNGVPIRNQAQFYDAFGNLRRKGDGFGLAVRRNGEVIDLNVPFSTLGPGFNQGLGAGQGTTTITPPADLNGGAPGLTPRSPGRSDAAQGEPGVGRSDARRGGIGAGRSQAAPRNNRVDAPQNDATNPNGAGTQNDQAQGTAGTTGQAPAATTDSPVNPQGAATGGASDGAATGGPGGT